MTVLMFHSIGCEKQDWYRNWLSVSLDHFENFCKFLVKHNFETVFLDEWYSYNNTSKKSKKIVITFDDGYLDNWVYAYPILKKYNLKGTIFVNPEFVDPSKEVRNNLLDVWKNKIGQAELSPLGFLNWSEIKILEDSGVMDIQSHSMSHNFYFYSNIIKDIYTGQPQYDWLPWIYERDRKPFYNTENQKDYVSKGHPIFQFGRALGLRRYFPDENLILFAKDSIDNNSENLNKKELINLLNEKLEEYPGKYESDEEMLKRYKYELFESKKIIEEKLNKRVDYLCWPGGGYNKESVQISIEAGYKASTYSTKNKEFLKQDFGNYKNIKRKAMTSFISSPTKNHYIENPNFLVNLFKYHQGSQLSKFIYRTKKLQILIRDKIIS